MPILDSWIASLSHTLGNHSSCDHTCPYTGNASDLELFQDYDIAVWAANRRADLWKVRQHVAYRQGNWRVVTILPTQKLED